MTLRRDPERDYRARRATILGRLTHGARVDAASAERWIAEWEERAGAVGIRRESPAFWSSGLRWIAGQRGRLDAETGALRDVS